MTELPLWAVYTVAFGTPLSALLGVLLTLWLTRRSARELDVRGRREEVMRNLRWATELAADQDDAKRAVGVQQLGALGESELLDPRDQVFIDAALRSVSSDAHRSVTRALPADVEVDVVRLDDAAQDDRGDSGVSSIGSDEDRSKP